MFVGVGLTALPLDLIIDFFKRPKKLNESEAENKKNSLLAKTMALMKIAEDIKKKNTIAEQKFGTGINNSL
jgi:hypothetical protein